MKPEKINNSPKVIYPDSDGERMAENTKHFDWMVKIEQNLELLFAKQPDAFVAGDLLWYPVEGNNKIRQAPDAMVAFGRPKGDRGSYKQWEEDNIPPQVVFELFCPETNRQGLAEKFEFYNRYGVEEYYLYDYDRIQLTGFLRSGTTLAAIEPMNGWVSPRLGLRFELKSDALEIYHPDEERFLSFRERYQLLKQYRQNRQRAEQERQRAEAAAAQLEEEQQRYQQLIEQLRQRGIDPEQL